MPSYFISPTSDQKQQWTLSGAASGFAALTRATNWGATPTLGTNINDAATSNHIYEPGFVCPTLASNEFIIDYHFLVYCTPSPTGSGNAMKITIPDGSGGTVTTNIAAGAGAGWQGASQSGGAGFVTAATVTGFVPLIQSSSLSGSGTNTAYQAQLLVSTLLKAPRAGDWTRAVQRAANWMVGRSGIMVPEKPKLWTPKPI